MPSVHISIDFPSDNGDAEKFTGDTTYYTDGVYDAVEGNPAGCVRFDAASGLSLNITNKYFPLGYPSPQQTFEDWGVPAGASITGISNVLIDAAYKYTGSTDGGHNLIFQFFAATHTVLTHATGTATGDRAWTSIPFYSESLFWQPYASTDFFTIAARLWADTGASGTGKLYFDNISFDIDYSTAVTHTGTGVLSSQDSVATGYSQITPATHETAKVQTVDEYQLYIDGILTPFTDFKITRNVITELAEISIPVLFEPELDAATTIVVKMVSTNIYGGESVTDLFSGSLDKYSSNDTTLKAFCFGPVTYPANVVRDFNNVSYTSDDGVNYMYRLKIDPRFYPGDVGMYGSRRIRINRVVMYANQFQATMELVDNGQM